MAKRLNRRKRGLASDVAEERVHILIERALGEYRNGNEELAKKIGRLAHKIRLRHRIRLKKEWRLKYCKRCFVPWVAGRSVRIRNDGKNMCKIYTCECGYIKRIGYRKK